MVSGQRISLWDLKSPLSVEEQAEYTENVSKFD